MFVPKYVKKILIDHNQLFTDISKAGNWLNHRFKDYWEKEVRKPPLMICVLKGALQFYSFLLLNVDFDVSLDFISISSYQGEMSAVSAPKIIHGLRCDCKDRDVIIVEDLIDKGASLKALYDLVASKGAKSITTMVLVDKVDCREVPFEPDYAVFKIKGDPYIVGYGIDACEKGRNLSYIAEFDKSYVDKIKFK